MAVDPHSKTVNEARRRVGIPDSVEGELLHRRLMATLFGREAPVPRFGRFELRDRIGRGGMGIVYEAWDPQLQRCVAVKLVDTRGASEGVRGRAVREARSLAKLSHPNVVTVFESGLVRQRVWIAMELVSGATLGEWRASQSRSATEILRCWIAVGRGLHAAHEAGLVHRDIKPSNVLIGDDERPRLIDFGLAHGSLDTSSPEGGPHQSARGSSSPERTRGFAGTYRYAAPEQREAGLAEPAADQYSLCVCMWEALCGAVPPALPDQAMLPAKVRAVLERGLSAQPERRFASVAVLVDELEATLEPRAHRLAPWLAGVGSSALALGVGLAQWGAEPEIAEPCPVESRALEGIWDDDRREALRQAIESTDVGYADSSWRALEAGLDTWARSWLDARRSACVATRVEGTQSEQALDLRVACLQQQARSVRITLDTFTDSQEDVGEVGLVARAPALLERLPAPAICDDPQPLAEVEARPESGPEREAIDEVYDGISRARTLASMGDFDGAQTLVQEIEAQWPLAQRYAPVRIELQALPFQIMLERGRGGGTLQRLTDLSREAEARHLDELAADLRVQTAVAAAGHWRSARLERFVVEEAAAALERLGRPRDVRWAAVRHAEATLALKSGRFEEALAGFREARARASEGGDHARAERERWEIAFSLAQLGRRDEARALLHEGRDLAEARWGRGAPLVGYFEYDLAVLAQESGRFEEAEAHLQRAEKTYEAAFGGESFFVARIRYAEAKLRMVEGDFEGALALVGRALVVYRRELGSEHEGLVDLHEARGVLRFFTGDLEGSIEDYDVALRMGVAVLPEDDPTLARLHSNKGESEAALGRLEPARHSFGRALELYARTLPSDHPELALPLKGRGQVALASGRLESAIADLERALELVSEGEPLETADIRFSLAQALYARGGRPEDALAFARRAREGFRQSGVEERSDEIDRWLATRVVRRSPASGP